MELTPTQQRKLLSAAKLVESGDMAVLEKILEFEDFIEQKEEKIKGYQAIVEEGINEWKETTQKALDEINAIEKGAQGEQGEQGRDGQDGKDGKNGKDGRDGRDGRDGLDGADGQDGKDGISPTSEEIVRKLNDDKIPMSAVEDLEDTIATLQNRTQLLNQIATQGQRSSGSGGSALTVKDEGSTLSSAVTSIDFVGAGVTATNTGGAVTVTISTSSGAGYQAPTGGSVDGSNTVFTWAVEPNALSVDGIILRKTASDTTVNWSGTTTTTLSVAPTFDIFGVA